MPTLTVYSRRGCHLCEQLLEELEPLIRGYAQLVVEDIDTDAALRARYDTAVPVVALEGREICRYHLDRTAVLAAIDALSTL